MSRSNLILSTIVADVLSISKATLGAREKLGILVPIIKDGKKYYNKKNLEQFELFQKMENTNWDKELLIKPTRDYKSIELFAGAGGLAIGLEKAGFNAVMLNEIDKKACETLRLNRPKWNVIEGDIAEIDFTQYKDIDFISGGFPCQAFSYAGNKLGFEDARGTLFYEFARAIKETQPKVFMGENVRGLLSHDNGKTLEAIKSIIADLGYTLIKPHILRAIFYQVPQKRERLILIGIRNDLAKNFKFSWPSPYRRVMDLNDAFKAGELYKTDVPESEGQKYPERKTEIMSLVPEGGYWRNLPIEAQKEYMKNSFYMGGGKTGMARRLAWESPSLTLTCAPAQKQTERCHPKETRPLTVREYARIQTFPDEWAFAGALTSQYKQIGNAVPVNLGYAIGRRLISLLNSIK